MNRGAIPMRRAAQCPLLDCRSCSDEREELSARTGATATIIINVCVTIISTGVRTRDTTFAAFKQAKRPPDTTESSAQQPGGRLIPDRKPVSIVAIPLRGGRRGP